MQVGCCDGHRYLDIVGAVATREDNAVIARVECVVTVGIGEVKALCGHGEGYRRGGAGLEAHALELDQALERHRMLLAGLGADGVADLMRAKRRALEAESKSTPARTAPQRKYLDPGPP